MFFAAQDPVPVSSLLSTPSLAEELKAALLAERWSCMEGKDDEEEALLNSFPKGFHLDLDLHNNDESALVLDLSDLGSPEQIDPVNKYGDVFGERSSGEKKACRKSCCLSDVVLIGRVSEKGLKDVATAPGGVTVSRSTVNAECQSDTAEKDLNVGSRQVSTAEAGCGADIPMDPGCQNTEVFRSLSSINGQESNSVEEMEQRKDKVFLGNDQGQHNSK